MHPIVNRQDMRVAVMTGAGISAESGIQTFRGANGLWRNHRIEEVASPVAFRHDPKLVWEFYLLRRKQALACEPNPAHHALVALENWLAAGGGTLDLVTQNVDGLHLRAGSTDIVEMHGSLLYSRCTACGEVFRDETVYEDYPPFHDCAARGMLRPHIVWFGEALFDGDLDRIERSLAGCDLFLVVGTSGVVYPAAGLVGHARALGKETVCVNLEPPANADLFDRYLEGKAGEVLSEHLFPGVSDRIG